MNEQAVELSWGDAVGTHSFESTEPYGFNAAQTLALALQNAGAAQWIQIHQRDGDMVIRLYKWRKE